MNGSLSIADEAYTAFHEGTDVEVIGLLWERGRRGGERLENLCQEEKN